MKKPNKRKFPDAMHEAMDIPFYTKPPMQDGSAPVGKKKEKKNKHERSESKKFERKEKRTGSEPEYR